MVRFKQSQFSGDVNWLKYNGTWVANDRDDHWYIREIVNRKEVEHSPNTTYIVFLSEIYTDLIKDVSKWEALTFGGIEKLDYETTPEWEKVLVYYQYGLADVITSVSGNNYKQLFKQIRSYM